MAPPAAHDSATASRLMADKWENQGFISSFVQIPPTTREVSGQKKIQTLKPLVAASPMKEDGQKKQTEESKATLLNYKVKHDTHTQWRQSQ